MASTDDRRPEADLGPFAPPRDYRFEDELTGPPPRVQDDRFKEGRHALARRRSAAGGLVAGALLAGLGLLPIVETIGIYLLPLQYLTWIGIGIFALGGVFALGTVARGGPYCYAETGTPEVVRVLDIQPVVAALTNGVPTSYRYRAVLERLDPATGAPARFAAESSPFSAAEAKRLTTTYEAGDYATAISLPGDPERTRTLYGFLDLRPGLGLVRRDGAKGTSLLGAVAATVFVLVFLGGLVGSVYAIGRYGTIGPTSRPLSTAAIVAIVPALALIRRGWTQSGRSSGGFGRLVAALGTALISVSISFGVLLTLNATLDGSPALPRPVAITGLSTKTYRFLFRTYQVDYRFLDGDRSGHQLTSTPSEMNNLGLLAVAATRAGRFGWPWVDAIRPAP